MAVSLKVDNKIFDHNNNKFVDLDTPLGQQIQQLNKICELCPANKIYNVSTKRCVSKTGPKAKELANEIAYCNKYDAYIKRTINSDMKIIENILNIKIGKKLLPKNKKSFKIKDIFEENLKKSDPNLASRLNIKDLRIKGYINYLPSLFYALVQVINMNTDIKKYVLSTIINILASIKNGIISTYLKIFTDYIKSPFLINIIANLSFTKFLVFISGLMVILTNLPSKMRNKSSVSRIAEVGLTGKDGAPFTVEDKLLRYDVDKPVQLNETSKMIVSDLNAYNNKRSTISLSKLGLNTRDIADKDTRMFFSYDDTNQLPFAEVWFKNNPKQSYYILPKDTRTKKLKELKTKTKELNTLFEEKKKEISDKRETHSRYLKSLELKDELSKLDDEMSSLKKFTPMYNKYTARINKTQKELVETQNYLKKKEYTPLDIKELSKLQPKLSNIVNWQSSLNKTYKELSQLDETNFNVYYSVLDNRLDSAKNELVALNQADIIISANPVTNVTQYIKPVSNVSSVPLQPASNIGNNLANVNQNLKSTSTNAILSIFDNISDEELFKPSSSKLSQMKKDFKTQRKTKMMSFVNENDAEIEKMLADMKEGIINPSNSQKVQEAKKKSSSSDYDDYSGYR